MQGIGCCFYVHGILQKLRGQVTKDEVLLPAEVAAATAYPPEEPSESPRHFAASMDESVIVGYYTLKKCRSPALRCLQISRKGQKSMARNDGIDRTIARNQDLPTPDDVAKIQEHNEREKDSYSNQDIVPERTPLNIHFKAPQTIM